MASIYKYVSVSNSGQRINGEREAETKDDVVNYLHSKDLIVVSVDETFGFKIKNIFSSEIGGMSLKERVLIVKQLATMISANIPIIQAIDILVQQSDKASLKDKFKNVYKAIEAGSPLSEAFRKEGGIFSEVHLNLLSAGEKSANLNEMLVQISDDLEKSNNLRGKITGALIYPAIILVAVIVVIFIMLTSMVPQVKDLYLSLGKTDLPAVTQILVNIGTGLSNPAVIITLIIVITSLFALYKYYNSTRQGKRFFNKIQLKLPIFGSLIQKAELAQFCRLTAMLLKSGLQIIETMTIVANASDNQIFKELILLSEDEVINGSSLSVAIAKYNKDKAFPVILIKIIGTSEESGKLDQVLGDMARFYENEVDQIASNLTKLLEPLIMLVVGGLVGFLAIAIYLPIFDVTNLVK